MRLRLTTNPGLEDLVIAEAQSVLGRAGLAVEPTREHSKPSGRVELAVGGDPAQAVQAALTLRSVHHVLQPLGRHTLSDTTDATRSLAEVRDFVAGLDLSAFSGVRSFRATCERKGSHAFSSNEVAAAAGGGVRAQHPGLAVDLENHDVNLRVDVRGDSLDASLQLTDRSLGRRSKGPYHPRVTLKPPVGWCMWTLATAHLERPPRAVLDPCCGSGTTLLEAGARWPEARLLGSDAYPVPVGGSRDNLSHHGLTDRAEIREVDARELDAGWPELVGGDALDAIVVNPPFGRRLGQRFDLFDLYFRLLRSSARLLAPGKRLVILATARRRLNKAVRYNPVWHTVDARVVETGGIWPVLLTLERRPDRAPASGTAEG